MIYNNLLRSLYTKPIKPALYSFVMTSCILRALVEPSKTSSCIRFSGGRRKSIVSCETKCCTSTAKRSCSCRSWSPHIDETELWRYLEISYCAVHAKPGKAPHVVVLLPLTVLICQRSHNLVSVSVNSWSVVSLTNYQIHLDDFVEVSLQIGMNKYFTVPPQILRTSGIPSESAAVSISRPFSKHDSKISTI